MFFLQCNEVLSSNIKEKNSLNLKLSSYLQYMKLKITKHRLRTVEIPKFKQQDVFNPFLLNHSYCI